MKDFIIIGNKNAVTCKEVFPLFKDNKVRLGYNTVKTFCTCNGTKDFGNVGWYSTLPVEKKTLTLTQRYSPAKYPKYDNYDAIEVSKVKDIPYDYEGVMGVPVTIFNYNLSQFEIIGKSGDKNWVNESGFYIPFTKENEMKARAVGSCFGRYNIWFELPDGTMKEGYKRIFIRKVQFEIVGRSGDIEYARGCGFFTPPSEEQSEEYKSMNKTWRVQNPYFVKGGSAETIYNRIFIRRK